MNGSASRANALTPDQKGTKFIQFTYVSLSLENMLLCDVMFWGADTQSDMACQQNRELFSIYEAIPYSSGQSALPYVAGAF
ncbi:hypothetical protein L2E82_05152 [Cichorium intybus]|uniref:Uncharacterized protein n=1 Tax=Cichorium intybus TaxID=13427 RepID=A0ACB9H6K0_CICIN|nr:hypothetical protein L2E82_05152 [Cichorium intybus]